MVKILKKTRYGLSSMLPPGHYDAKVVDSDGDTWTVEYKTKKKGKYTEVTNTASCGLPKEKGKKMEERALVALEKCIEEKWIPLASGEFEGGKEPKCALCEVFRFPEDDDQPMCAGCPVKERTGQSNCDGSLYREWSSLINSGCEYNDPTVVAAAKRELEFLRSLLPKKEEYKKATSLLHLELADALARIREFESKMDLMNKSLNYWSTLAKGRGEEVERLEGSVNHWHNLVVSYSHTTGYSAEELKEKVKYGEVVIWKGKPSMVSINEITKERDALLVVKDKLVEMNNKQRDTIANQNKTLIEINELVNDEIYLL